MFNRVCESVFFYAFVRPICEGRFLFRLSIVCGLLKYVGIRSCSTLRAICLSTSVDVNRVGRSKTPKGMHRLYGPHAYD